MDNKISKEEKKMLRDVVLKYDLSALVKIEIMVLKGGVTISAHRRINDVKE